MAFDLWKVKGQSPSGIWNVTKMFLVMSDKKQKTANYHITSLVENFKKRIIKYIFRTVDFFFC